MFKSIALAILVLIAVILGYAATKPDTFRVERTTSIKASPEKIFPLISDFRQWTAWSPWEKKDPAMKRTHSGAPAGKGAAYAWEGNSEVGAGRMEIVESTPTSKVGIKLDFIKPFEGHNVADFNLVPKGETTNVTWTMSGPRPFIAKVMSVFMDIDTMIGKDFEVGLANMKIVAEK